MCRFLALFSFAICSVYGGICLAAPSIVAVINGADYSDRFVVTPIAQGYSITGSFSNNDFTFAFDATTKADPDINYHLSIGGDPTVQLTILQPFLGGPFPVFVGSSMATITDANLDGRAFLLGSPLINTAIINGVLAGQYDTGCDLTGTPGFTAACPSSRFQGLAASSIGSTVVGQTMELKLGFSLSDGDFATLNGFGVLSVPEPAAGSLLASGLLAAWIALRRRGGRSTHRVLH